MGWPKGVPRKKLNISPEPTEISKVISPTVVIIPEPKFIVFGKPDIGEAEIAAVSEVMRSGWIGTGKIGRKFEEKFSEFMGGGHSVAVNSCTMAMQLALRVCNLGENKEVITTPLTFAATINAILREGAKPIFIDVDDRGCLNPDYIKGAMTNKTQGLLPVHYTGSAVNMGELDRISKFHGLAVIEDAAHGFGGEYIQNGHGRKLGSIGDFGCFSFYSTKNITCSEGGMVFTRNGELAERIRTLSNQGQTSGAWNRYTNGPILPYEIAHDGYKGNLPDILAAIGLVQLERWPELQEKRSKIWRIYEDNFGLKEPGHSMHLYTIKVKNRDSFRMRMWEAGIGTGIHFTPLHLEPGFKFLGSKEGDFPVSERIGKETVSLPISTTMTEDDVYRVVNAVKSNREE